MEVAAQAERSAMTRYLVILDTVITLSPLLGLLGTVTGMIRAFGVVATSGMNEPHAITGGVAEALVATAAGLAVAIVTLVPYNYFLRRVERGIEDMERVGPGSSCSSRRARREAPGPPARKARIEIIPMIDTVFFLLVFFMMASLSMTVYRGMPVSLPRAASGSAAPARPHHHRHPGRGDVARGAADPSSDALAASSATASQRRRPRGRDPCGRGGGPRPRGGVLDAARIAGVSRLAIATAPRGGPTRP